MGLKELLQAFLDFRCSVVERRARFKLSQAQERRHIVEVSAAWNSLKYISNISRHTGNI
ncbi:DNA gyrase subunit A, chloroplastic/mitochondrial [Glycine soja]|uniref:DNA gyrase subunit A, chloroplastic/mitochondrial n=1 Tax=Glycine soja TaxID=3848 RepID=A0A0B2SHI5_GLYSO|nr:DNA gyrase subunit A, chloroplastic/mitochondrial [Glycine soja]